jgi:hypothetical protein
MLLPLSDFEETVFDSPEYASIEGVGGYVFLEDMTVSAEKFSEREVHSYKDGERVSTRKLDEPKRFFKLCIEHGTDPVGDTYAYATVPYATDGELREYKKTSGLEIISNTPECQAVRKKPIGYTSYVFYKAGACEDVEVTEPCIVNLYEKDGVLTVSACDPTMKLEEIVITVNTTLVLLDADEKVSVKASDKTALTIDCKGSVGRSYNARLRY